MKKSARVPFVIKVFVPLIRKESPSFLAVVERSVISLPWSGSV
jgi:hypothetical protein